MTIDTKRLKTDAAYWDQVAPEGATHADSTNPDPYHWLKNDGDKWFSWSGRDWWEYRPVNGEVDRDFIPRPTKPAAPEWDGEGLPNVGEMVMHPRYGEPCRLRWIGKSSCVIESNFGDEYFAAMEDLEPIRTKEQRQRDELEYLIESAYATNGVKGVADAMESSYNLEPKDA